MEKTPMLTYGEIRSNFDAPVELADGVLKFSDATPASTYFYYLQRDAVNRRDLLAVSEDADDDILAGNLLRAAGRVPYDISRLALASLDSGGGCVFSHVLLAPPEYHSYLKGILDAERQELLLVLPVFRSEFSGDESVELFYELRRRFFPTLDWRRSSPCPRVLVRFDNPDTGGGTFGDAPVPICYSVLRQEIQDLDGVTSGFIEVTNYLDEYAEVVSTGPGAYTFRKQDEPCSSACSHAELLGKLWRFLTGPQG